MLELAGLFVPLITPFTDDGATISEVRLARLLRFYTDRGAEGFIVGSDLGEFTSLTLAERKELFEWVHRHTQASLPIIVNASALSTSSCLDLAQHASRHGARAVTLMPPFYGSFSQAEHVEHIRTVAAHSDRPIIVVDPQCVLQESATGEIGHVSNVHLAWSTPDSEFTASDWFRCYGVSAEPMAAVPSASRSDFLLRHRAAVAKTLLLDEDLEIGKPRMPVLPIPYRDIRKAA
jgi:hypothetical protein